MLRVGVLAGAMHTPLLAAAQDAARSHSRAPAELALWLIGALALLALAGACVWLVWRERQLAQRLRQVRQQQRALSDLLDVWQWRSGPDHRITGIRPPQDADGSAWSARALGAPLWEQFPAGSDATLRARLDAHAPLINIEVRIGNQADAPTGRLHASALTDAQGAFAGYLGVVRLAATTVMRTASAEATPSAHAAASAPTSAAVTTAPMSEVAPDETIVYTLSHDLRAPIRVIEGFARILKEDYGASIDRIGNDHIDRVLGAAARMSHMIDALLGLSRLSAQALQRQPVNLSQLAAYVAEDLRRQTPQRRVELHIEPGLQVQGDPTLLRMVLENLLGNAWKYTGKRTDAQIWFERKPDEARTVFTVRDNGAGFDMRFADRLFGAFQRLHSATEFQGTGVGLVSVRRIVRRHGGEVWAESAPGQGARFHFTLSADGR